MADNNSIYEEFKVTGENLLAKVREIFDEGNARRIIIKNEEGSVLIEIPVTAGLAVGVLTVWLAPILAAIGAIAAVVTNVTVVVEKTQP